MTIGIFSVATLIAIAIGGDLGPDTGLRAVLLFVPYSVALWVGSRLFQKASDDLYRRAALWLLMAMGITVLGI